MSDLNAGYTAKVVLGPSEVLRVQVSGTATVTPAYGAPGGTTNLNNASQDFGPYGVAARLDVTCTSGRADYALSTYQAALTPAQAAALTSFVASNGTAVPASYSVGTALVTLDQAGSNLAGGAVRITDWSEASPDPTAPSLVGKVPWAAGNAGVYDHIPTAPVDISGLASIGLWLRATPRVDGDAYTMVKVLFMDSATTATNFGQASFCVRADGKWRLHTLAVDQIAVGAGSWTKATPIARFRFREGDGNTTTNRAAMTASGEAFFFGTVRANPRQRAMGLVRFDDGLSNLARGLVNVAATFTGQSGVVLPAGSTYSMASILAAFGLPATAYVLTDLVGQTGFATVDELRGLQSSGWDIAFQSAANPVGGIGAGVRLLGPYGYSLAPPNTITALNTGTGVCTTAAERGIGGTSTGQFFPVTAIGTDLPPEIVAGRTYYLYRINATNFSIHSVGQGSVDGTTGKIIPSTTGTLANWGFRYLGAANDHTAIQAEFQRGYDWLVSNGFERGAEHYAPNQGAWDIYSERAILAFGKFKTVSLTALPSPGAAAPVFEPIQSHSVANDVTSATQRTLHAPWAAICNVIQTDVATSATESVVRGRVRAAVQNGWVITNYHHGQSFSTVLDMLWYLDELKLWRDRGMMDVLTISNAWARIDAARQRLAV